MWITWKSQQNVVSARKALGRASCNFPEKKCLSPHNSLLWNAVTSFSKKDCNTGIKISSSNDHCVVAVTGGKRKHRVRQEIYCFEVLKKFLHNWQEFCFAALNLNDAIERQEGGIIPKCWISSKRGEHVFWRQRCKSNKINSDDVKKVAHIGFYL